MTENEIIQILKDNKEKGIAFVFLHDEVKKYISKIKHKCLILNHVGSWIECSKTLDIFHFNDVISLPEDFELKKESEGEWVKFDIDENGDVAIALENEELACVFKWFEWERILLQRYDFISFGGWQYQNCKAWFMQPMLFQEDHYITNEFEKEPFKTEPVIPIKIRFWRISK